MSSDRISYFGYGSLVNRDTRPNGELAHSARLKNWRRVWEHRVTDPNRGQPCTSLSIEPVRIEPLAETGQNGASGHGARAIDRQHGIDGVVVTIPSSELWQLDQREAGYERLELPATDFELPPHFECDTVMVYRSLPENRFLADRDHPVLQSYVDCVMAGYLQRFGEPGVTALVNSTRGWERTIFDDRHDPFYPRWVHVEDHHKLYFDQHLASFR